MLVTHLFDNVIPRQLQLTPIITAFDGETLKWFILNSFETILSVKHLTTIKHDNKPRLYLIITIESSQSTADKFARPRHRLKRALKPYPSVFTLGCLHSFISQLY